MTKPSPFGATFAERKAAAQGEESFEAPTAAYSAPEANSTFGQRAGRTKPTVKAVDEDTKGAENKAVAPKRTRKKS